MKNFLPITLVIPTYNRGDLITETIHSAISQTLPFYEIIVVDDGSTDYTPNILRKFQSHVRVIRTPNRGVQEARNTGVYASDTDLISLLDSDDLLEPYFVQSVSEWMTKNEAADVLYVNFCTFDETGIHSDKFSLAPAGFFEGAKYDGAFLTNIPDLYRRSLKFQPFFPSGSVLRKQFFRHIGGYNSKFNGVGAEDWEFTLRAIDSGRVAACSTPLTKIRKHSGNDSRDSIRMSLGESQILEYCLKAHSAASTLQSEILDSIEKRKRDAFDGAFAIGNFAQADSILKQMRFTPRGIKLFLKWFIMSMPATLRSAIWRATQI